MKTVTGIFNSRSAAEQALQRLQQSGFTNEEISFLTPQSSDKELNAVPTSEGEQPGMGSALGGVVGGAVGLSGGMIAAALSSVLIPGVGTVLALGFAGAALAGTAGAVGGAKAGSAVENALTEGFSKDELYFYIDELKKGRSVIICRTEDEARLENANQILGSYAHSLDAARDNVGVGLGDATGEQKSGDTDAKKY